MRNWEVEYLVPSHAQIVEGRAEIGKILTNYRDAMQVAAHAAHGTRRAGWAGASSG